MAPAPLPPRPPLKVRPRARLALTLMLGTALLLAGCAAPDEGASTGGGNDGGKAADDAPRTQGRTVMAAAPDARLQVDHLGDGTVSLTFTNARDEPIRLSRDNFTFNDATGASYSVNASATDALDDAFPNETELAPEDNVSGTLAFDLANVTMPVRVAYDSDGIHSAWLLHVSDYRVELAPADDTSFGAPIRLPANATFQYQVNDASQPIDVCLIMEEDHERWRASGRPDGLACRGNVQEADVSSTVPPGEYNVGMYCRSSTEPCIFTVTVVAAW